MTETVEVSVYCGPKRFAHFGLAVLLIALNCPIVRFCVKKVIVLVKTNISMIEKFKKRLLSWRLSVCASVRVRIRTSVRLFVHHFTCVQSFIYSPIFSFKLVAYDVFKFKNSVFFVFAYLSQLNHVHPIQNVEGFQNFSKTFLCFCLY